MEQKSQKNYKINEQVIELTVANIRKKQICLDSNNDKWEQKLRQTVSDCPDDYLDISRAYGDDPKLVAAILRAKINDPRPTKTTNENEPPVSFGKGIDALKKFKKSKEITTSDLFRVILSIDGTEIDVSLYYSQLGCFANTDFFLI